MKEPKTLLEELPASRSFADERATLFRGFRMIEEYK